MPKVATERTSLLREPVVDVLEPAAKFVEYKYNRLISGCAAGFTGAGLWCAVCLPLTFTKGLLLGCLVGGAACLCGGAGCYKCMRAYKNKHTLLESTLFTREAAPKPVGSMSATPVIHTVTDHHIDSDQRPPRASA